MSRRAGAWVKVWGQVVDGQAHPEDIRVELFSHNEQYEVLVDRERVEAAEVPPFASQCSALLAVKPNRLRRCERHHDHGGPHQNGTREWDAHLTVGYMEDK